jgi:hypothetical protein
MERGRSEVGIWFMVDVYTHRPLVHIGVRCLDDIAVWTDFKHPNTSNHFILETSLLLTHGIDTYKILPVA